MKFSTLLLLILVSMSCSSKRNNASVSIEPEKDTLTKSEEPLTQSRTVKVPLDTLQAVSTDGKSVHLLIYSFHDLEEQKIKSFEVMNTANQSSLFLARTDTLFIVELFDPMTDEYDSMKLIPVYSIISLNPLRIDISFLKDGYRGIEELSELIYPVTAEASYLNFATYQINLTSQAKVQTQLNFNPLPCNNSSENLYKEFLKDKGTYNGLINNNAIDLLKRSFICFLNNQNSHYSEISKGFDEVFGPNSATYTYHPFVAYLDDFYIN